LSIYERIKSWFSSPDKLIVPKTIIPEQDIFSGILHKIGDCQNAISEKINEHDKWTSKHQKDHHAAIEELNKRLERLESKKPNQDIFSDILQKIKECQNVIGEKINDYDKRISKHQQDYHAEILQKIEKCQNAIAEKINDYDKRISKHQQDYHLAIEKLKEHLEKLESKKGLGQILGSLIGKNASDVSGSDRREAKIFTHKDRQ